MQELSIKRTPLSIPKKEINFSDLEGLDLHSGRSTIKNIIKLMLWKKKPVFLNGMPLNRNEVESKKKKKEDDHFYPFDLCNNSKINNRCNINSILNLCYFTKEENASKQDTPPSHWLRSKNEHINADKKRQRTFFESNLLPFDSIEDLENFEKQFVNEDGSFKPLKFNKDYQKFLKKRFEIFKRELNRLQNGK